MKRKRKGPRAVLQPGPPTTETAAAAASTDPMAMNDDEREPQETVLASPGNESPSSDSEDDAGAQDAQDRMTEGPLTARKLGNYKPTYFPIDSKVTTQVTVQPTGSDALWRDRLALDRNTQPTTGRYECIVCGARFPASTQAAEHMLASHQLAIEPNYLHSYSVGEVVSGKNAFAMGKRFRAGLYAEKPKLKLGDNGKIPWMGKPLLEAPLKPTSLNTIANNSMVDTYRTVPSHQLSSMAPSADLRERMIGEFIAQSTGTSGQ
eukprot:5071901-Amphidinium_carterae.1